MNAKPKTVIHHWRWRSPRFLITCGAKGGLIDLSSKQRFDCGNCKKVIASKPDGRGWPKTAKVKHE